MDSEAPADINEVYIIGPPPPAKEGFTPHFGSGGSEDRETPR